MRWPGWLSRGKSDAAAEPAPQPKYHREVTEHTIADRQIALDIHTSVGEETTTLAIAGIEISEAVADRKVFSTWLHEEISKRVQQLPEEARFNSRLMGHDRKIAIYFDDDSSVAATQLAGLRQIVEGMAHDTTLAESFRQKIAEQSTGVAQASEGGEFRRQQERAARIARPYIEAATEAIGEYCNEQGLTLHTDGLTEIVTAALKEAAMKPRTPHMK